MSGRRSGNSGERAPGPFLAVQRAELWAGEEWLVRPVTGADAAKTYRCPGCDQEIRAGLPHVVVWPAEGPGAVEDRRHWHTPCWAARERRSRR